MFNGCASYSEFCTKFETEEACERALYQLKWPDGFRCPRCSFPEAYITRTRRLPLYECKSCRYQSSVIAGTILEGSRTPLPLWLRAIYLHSMPYAMTATELSRTLNVTYKTAWLIGHKLRHAIGSADACELLSGFVRMHVIVYRRARILTFREKSQDQSLLLGASLDENGEPRHVKIKKVAVEHLRVRSVRPFGVQAFISENVAPGTSDLICVPQLGSPDRIRQLFGVHIEMQRWMYRFWSGIGQKHLEAYLNQFCFFWNMKMNGKTVFEELLRLSATMPTVTYPVLIGQCAAAPRLVRTTKNRERRVERIG